MKWITQLVALSTALAAATWLVGWWMLLLVAAAYGAWQARARATVWTATLAGALSWSLLLGYDAVVGPAGRLSALMGAMIHASRFTFAVLTVCYAALLCASAAAFARTLRRLTLPA